MLFCFTVGDTDFDYLLNKTGCLKEKKKSDSSPPPASNPIVTLSQNKAQFYEKECVKGLG